MPRQTEVPRQADAREADVREAERQELVADELDTRPDDPRVDDPRVDQPRSDDLRLEDPRREDPRLEDRLDDPRPEDLRAEPRSEDFHEETRPDDLSDGELDAELDGEPLTERPLPDQSTVDSTVETSVDEGLWASTDVDGLRERWREIQLRFVDDPQGAAADAAALADEAADSLIAALQAQRSELSAPQGETEQLRLAVQRYRGFLDRVLAV